MDKSNKKVKCNLEAGVVCHSEEALVRLRGKVFGSLLD